MRYLLFVLLLTSTATAQTYIPPISPQQARTANEAAQARVYNELASKLASERQWEAPNIAIQGYINRPLNGYPMPQYDVPNKDLYIEQKALLENLLRQQQK